MHSIFSVVKKGFIYVRKNGLYKTGRKAVRKIAFARKYERWIAHCENVDEEQIRHDIDSFQYRPLFSVCIPVYNVEEKWLRKCIASVENQYYEHWQLCLADDCSTDPRVRDILKEYEQKDSRIQVVYRTENGHISRATNSALQIAKGDFVVLMDNDDELVPHALYEVARVLQDNRNLDVLYSDEDKINEKGKRSNPHFKPDYCPDTLLSNNYISHLTVYRRRIVEEAGGFRTGVEGAQDYDLLLRVTELTDRIGHIPKILYHWRAISGSTALDGGEKGYAYLAGKKALEDAIKRRGYHARVTETRNSPCYNVKFLPVNRHFISVILMPEKEKAAERCLQSVFANTSNQSFEILFIENAINKKIIGTLFRRYREIMECCVVKSQGVEKTTTLKNKAVRQAKGDLLLFLNPDLEIRTKQWLQLLAGEAERDSIGAVGAKLLGPDNRIRQAGQYLDGKCIYRAVGRGREEEDSGYMYYLSMRRNYSAVSGDCLMVKKQTFEEAGGFDESLDNVFCSVDLCLKLRQKGYRNLFLPDVVLRYSSSEKTFQKKSKKENNQEISYMRKKWGKELSKDPCNSRWFSLDSIRL